MNKAVREAFEVLTAARMLLAMSMEQAKQALGFNPHDNPSPQEVKKAYLKLVMQNHPDRGGDPDKMKEINVAKEIMDGTRMPDKTFSPSTYSPPSSKPYSYSPPKKKVVTVDEALRQAAHADGLSDVKWLFATSTQTSKGSYYGSETSRTEDLRVLVGKDSQDNIVLLALSNQTYDGGVNEGSYDIWTAHVHHADRKVLFDAAAMSREVSKAFASSGLGIRFNGKVRDIMGMSLKEAMKTMSSSGYMNVRQFLTGLGLISEPASAPGSAPKKQAIEVVYRRTGFDPDEQATLEFHFNGRKEKLTPEDWKRVRKIVYAMFGTQYLYDDTKKNLMRTKNGKKAMRWMLAHLQDLSPQLREAFSLASAE